MRAFVLGAGLGTRLRPLTENLPKPMVPVFGRPLIALAWDHLVAAGVEGIVVNTHHCADAYVRAFGVEGGGTRYRGRPVTFRHEPVLLDTGGGIKNVEDILGGESFFLHNGDILADLDLRKLARVHHERGDDVTLGLRSAGGPLQVGWDPTDGRVVDIRGTLGAATARRYVYTGIAVLSPRVFDFLETGAIASVVPAWLRMISGGCRVGGVLLDDGLWIDIGTREACFEAHRMVDAAGLSYADAPGWPCRIDPTAESGGGSSLEGFCVIGAGARIGAGSRLEDCIVWPGAKIADGIRLRDCIIRSSADHPAENQIL